MKILYIHQYFKTPEQGGAIRSYYLAKGLASRGFEVTMITSHNEKKYQVKQIDGVEVHYLPVKYDNQMGFMKRAWSFLKFVHLATKLALNLPRHDVCYATSTPLTVGIIAMRLKAKLELPYFFEVRDLWPEAPIQMGAIPWNWLKKRLRKLEKDIYLEADKIVALSPGIRQGIEQLVPHKRVFVIPNISDIEFFKPQTKNHTLERKYGTRGKFVISYFGALGPVNAPHSIIDLARAIKKEKLAVRFLIMGAGKELAHLKELVSYYNLEKILNFIPFGSKAQVSEVLNVTDATYISFASKTVLESNSPNKFFDGLAAGKLTIVNFSGWIRELIEQHECGMYMEPTNKASMAKLKNFISHPELLLAHQRNARNLAESFYSRELQVQKLHKMIDNEYMMRVSDDQVYILTA